MKKFICSFAVVCVAVLLAGRASAGIVVLDGLYNTGAGTSAVGDLDLNQANAER